MTKFIATEATYTVTLTHPTGFHKEPAYAVKVTTTTETEDGEEVFTVRRCDAQPFGCSRDYWVASDKEAIVEFLREHLCSVVSSRKMTK